MHSRHSRNGGNCDGLSTEGLCSQAGPQARPAVRGQADLTCGAGRFFVHRVCPFLVCLD